MASGRCTGGIRRCSAVAALLLALWVGPGLACGPAPRRSLTSSSGNKIANGNVAAPGQFPYFTSLYRPPGAYEPRSPLNNYCGASLITPTIVMTAGHCTFQCDGTPLIPTYVRVGITEFNRTWLAEGRVKALYRHPGYDDSTLANDIALLELEEPINNVPLAKLAKPGLEIIRNERLVYIGMGQTPTSFLSSILLYTRVKFVSWQNCKKYYKGSGGIDRTSMCTGSLEANDACPGDSGSPLLTEDGTQVGIVSFGPNPCGGTAHIGAASDIRELRPWIDKMLKKIKSGGVRDDSKALVQAGESFEPPQPFIPANVVRGAKSENKIARGREAAEGQFPWAAALYKKRGSKKEVKHFCGGTLVAPDVILTAGHCVTNCRKALRWPDFVRVGMVEADDETAIKRKIKAIYVHPVLNWYRRYNDVALLQLDEPVTGVPLAKLAPAGTAIKEDQRLTVIGWGATPKKKAYSNDLMSTTVRFMTFESCKAYYLYDGEVSEIKPYALYNTTLCAGSLYTSNFCPGDAGGALIAQGEDPVQVGIASFTDDNYVCGKVDYPSGYSDVRALRPWIDATLKAIQGSGRT